MSERSVEVEVRTALASQEDLKQKGEHCSVDPATLAEIGADHKHQVRVVRTDFGVALYTVSEVRDDDPRGVVRMGAKGRQRLGAELGFTGTIDGTVPEPTLNDDDAERQGEFVERLQDDGRHRKLIAIAPHGGDIEKHTDAQAERVARRLRRHGVSAWRCKGWRPSGAFDAWHITSVDINEASFPLLRAVMERRRFTYAVAFHGFGPEEVLVGGGARLRLKQEVVEAVERALRGTTFTVRIAGPGDPVGGDDAENIVNRLTAGGQNGIQIEQGLDVREQRWEQIADAVASVYDRRLRRPWITTIVTWVDEMRSWIRRRLR